MRKVPVDRRLGGPQKRSGPAYEDPPVGNKTPCWQYNPRAGNTTPLLAIQPPAVLPAASHSTWTDNKRT